MEHPKLRYEGGYTSAHKLAARFGLAVPTIITRYAKGYRGKQLVAPAYSLPRGSRKIKPRLKRIPSVGQAVARHKRALAALDMAEDRLRHAVTRQETEIVLEALERQIIDRKRKIKIALANIELAKDMERRTL